MKQEEWLPEFRDKSYFRLQYNKFYIDNQKPPEDGQNGLKEMDFCYCTDNSIDLIECKETTNAGKGFLKKNLVDKALHSVGLLKTGLYAGNTHIMDAIKSTNKTCSADIRLNIYVIIKVDNRSKPEFPNVVRGIEGNIKKFLTNPFGRIWNIGEVKILTYEKAKKELSYIV